MDDFNCWLFYTKQVRYIFYTVLSLDSAFLRTLLKNYSQAVFLFFVVNDFVNANQNPILNVLEVRLTPTSAPFIDLSSFQPQKKEIVFVDSAVSAEKAFLESISPTIEVVEINALSGGLEQIAKVVANRSGLKPFMFFRMAHQASYFLETPPTLPTTLAVIKTYCDALVVP